MNDKKKKKEFVIPVAEIVDFTNEDIITASLTKGGTAEWDEGNRDWWA